MDVEAVIKALFDDDKDIAQVSPHIEGLGIVKQWLTDAEQTSLLAAIERERWLATSNQAMCFGSLPDWALSLGEAASQLLHSNGWVQDAEVQPPLVEQQL
ncbi:uncharacterized protein LOC104230716 isoform X2 [Haematococcus lacustris]|uniref:Uncharacterized protein LOC104230716 isoform X2 n=1 Tax=Haematococcus lacustris TaxID=44745 RepID=A0A6A0A3Q1_HAELA|nr:uncharacterized protein LOC104230716 isoform X2 [Haematococcus lacustris]